MMNMCDYVQNLFESYLVVSNSLHYDFDFIYNALAMRVGGRKVVVLSLDDPEWKVPIIKRIDSYIRDIENEYDFTVKITIDYKLRPEIDVKYL